MHPQKPVEKVPPTEGPDVHAGGQREWEGAREGQSTRILHNRSRCAGDAHSGRGSARSISAQTEARRGSLRRVFPAVRQDSGVEGPQIARWLFRWGSMSMDSGRGCGGAGVPRLKRNPGGRRREPCIVDRHGSIASSDTSWEKCGRVLFTGESACQIAASQGGSFQQQRVGQGLGRDEVVRRGGVRGK